MAINQEDDIGGTSMYKVNETSLLAANCYDESTYGKYENGAFVRAFFTRVSME